jgi:hypothetical protein
MFYYINKKPELNKANYQNNSIKKAYGPKIESIQNSALFNLTWVKVQGYSA